MCRILANMAPFDYLSELIGLLEIYVILKMEQIWVFAELQGGCQSASVMMVDGGVS